MSALKIPLLLSVALGIHITMTPPNPPPTETERLPPGGLERLGPWFPIVVKTSFWACFLAEIVVIATQRVSSTSPFFSAAAQTLAILDRAGRAQRLIITPVFMLGWALNLLGSSIRLYCYRRLRTLFTFELSIRENHHLITTGLYSIVRHPSYAGAVLAAVGVGLCHLTPGSWMVECSGLVRPDEPWAYKVMPIWVVGLSIASLGLSSRMRKEDQMLQEKFGKEWETWAGRVRYKVIPGVF
ncbi:hypothetical protein FB451DRAFT_365091 [Mycena latifolia]|nr:hypothetical protein FB451DRAFT_365091 [Mycena latifolia]